MNVGLPVQVFPLPASSAKVGAFVIGALLALGAYYAMRSNTIMQPAAKLPK